MWIGSLSYFESDHFEQTPAWHGLTAKQFPGRPGRPWAAGSRLLRPPGAKCPGADPGVRRRGLDRPGLHLPESLQLQAELHLDRRRARTSNFTAVATGNSDCDTLRSTFTRRGGIAAQREVTGGRGPRGSERARVGPYGRGPGAAVLRACQRQPQILLRQVPARAGRRCCCRRSQWRAPAAGEPRGPARPVVVITLPAGAVGDLAGAGGGRGSSPRRRAPCAAWRRSPGREGRWPPPTWAWPGVSWACCGRAAAS